MHRQRGKETEKAGEGEGEIERERGKRKKKRVSENHLKKNELDVLVGGDREIPGVRGHRYRLAARRFQSFILRERGTHKVQEKS